MKKRIFATLLALVMALVMALGLTVPAAADDPVTGVEFMDKNGVEQTCETYTEITEANKPNEWTNGWYVVKENVRIEPPTPTQIGDYHYAAVKSSGTVNLILCDGATLTVTVEPNLSGQLSGIYFTGSLTIYGQSEGAGQLVVEAKGTFSEGIWNDGTLTINGGNITAKGGVTGIRNSSTLTINGGKLTATGTKSNSAGIYNNESNSTVNINGGTVIASGGSGFDNDWGGSVNLPTAYWWRTAADGVYTKFVDDTTAYTPGEETYAEITTTQPAGWVDRVGYLDWDSANKRLNTTLSYREGAIEVAGHYKWGESGRETWYYVKDRTGAGLAEDYLKLDGGVTVKGTVHLILCDSAELIVDGGINIEDGASLTIYGQTAQSGKARIIGPGNGNGISIGGGSLTINGGEISASGGSLKTTSSGIQVGSSNSGTMTVNSGTVIARSAEANNGKAVSMGNGTLALPTAYWWRVADDGEFTKNTTAVYTPGAEKYAEITTTQPAGWVEPEQPTQPIRPSGNKGTTATPTETVASPNTADAGVLLTATLSVASLLGMGYVSKKR